MTGIHKMADLVQNGHINQIFGKRGAHVAQIEPSLYWIADSPRPFCPVDSIFGNLQTKLIAPKRNKNVHL